jgi:hypothetical protein
MPLSLGTLPPKKISVSDIARGYKRICGKENRAICEWKHMEILEMTIIPPKAGNFRSNGYFKGKNGDSHFSTNEKTADEAVLGKSLLEPRLLCDDGRDG